MHSVPKISKNWTALNGACTLLVLKSWVNLRSRFLSSLGLKPVSSSCCCFCWRSSIWSRKDVFRACHTTNMAPTSSLSLFIQWHVSNYILHHWIRHPQTSRQAYVLMQLLWTYTHTHTHKEGDKGGGGMTLTLAASSWASSFLASRSCRLASWTRCVIFSRRSLSVCSWRSIDFFSA